MWQVWGTRKFHIEFCWGNMKEKDHMEVLDVNGRIILT
jgi:hypothetical protein